MLTAAIYFSVYLLIGLVFALVIDRVVHALPSGAERYPCMASDEGFLIAVTMWPILVYLVIRETFKSVVKERN